MPNRTTHQNLDSDRSQEGQQAGRLDQDSQRKGSSSHAVSERAASDRDIQSQRTSGSTEQPRDAKGRFTDAGQRSRSASSRPGRADNKDQPRDAEGHSADDDR